MMLTKLFSLKNLLDLSDDYARSTAKSQFWYLDIADSVVLDYNAGIKARQLLTKRIEGGGNPPQRVKTIIPLNRFSYLEELEDKILPPISLSLTLLFGMMLN